MNRVFLWYPRRVWQVKDGAIVNHFMWLTWANDYTPKWRWPQRLKNVLMLSLPRFLRPKRKFKPFPPFNPNAYQEFLDKYPTVREFILDRRPITKDPDQTYARARFLSMVRRVMPTLIASEIVGVQPMTANVGQIFTLRYKYGENQTPNPQETENV